MRFMTLAVGAMLMTPSTVWAQRTGASTPPPVAASTYYARHRLSGLRSPVVMEPGAPGTCGAMMPQSKQSGNRTPNFYTRGMMSEDQALSFCRSSARTIGASGICVWRKDPSRSFEAMFYVMGYGTGAIQPSTDALEYAAACY